MRDDNFRALQRVVAEKLDQVPRIVRPQVEPVICLVLEVLREHHEAIRELQGEGGR